MPSLRTIQNRLQKIKNELNEDTTLVAVSKTKPVEEIESLYEIGNQASKNQQYFMFHHIRVKLLNSALIANHTEGPSNASFFRPLPE